MHKLHTCTHHPPPLLAYPLALAFHLLCLSSCPACPLTSSFAFSYHCQCRLVCMAPTGHALSILSILPPSSLLPLPPFPLLHLSGCTFRFNFVAIMHAKVQCFVGILFTQPPLYHPLPPASAPACWHFIACFIQQRFVCLAHSPSHSATVKMKCAKCTLSTAFINILVLVGVNTLYSKSYIVKGGK